MPEEDQNRANAKKPMTVSELSLSQLVGSLKLSQLWAAGVAVAAVLGGAFSFGYWTSDLQVAAFEQQITTLEQQNKLLKETQYDRALKIIQAQKELFNMEREQLEKQLDIARTSEELNNEQIAALKKRIDEVENFRVIVKGITVELTPEGLSLSTPTATIGVRG